MPYLDNLGLSHLWDIIKSKLALKANSSDVYTKTQIDNKGYITKSVNNLDNYTTTTALNTALNNKADKSTTYTKTEVDTALSSKANTSAIPTKVSDLTNDSAFITKSVSNLNNYYTKTSIDTSLSSKANTSDLANKQDKLVAHLLRQSIIPPC